MKSLSNKGSTEGNLTIDNKDLLTERPTALLTVLNPGIDVNADTTASLLVNLPCQRRAPRVHLNCGSETPKPQLARLAIPISLGVPSSR